MARAYSVLGNREMTFRGRVMVKSYSKRYIGLVLPLNAGASEKIMEWITDREILFFVIFRQGLSNPDEKLLTGRLPASAQSMK